jgi:hypothetical protein
MNVKHRMVLYYSYIESSTKIVSKLFIFSMVFVTQLTVGLFREINPLPSKHTPWDLTYIWVTSEAFSHEK